MAFQIWTREELLGQIALYKDALKKCASGHSYTIGSRSLTRQDLPEIRKQLDYFADELAKLSGVNGPRFVQGRINYGGRR
ncbi:MAG: DUF6148 family protein [Desulfovibrio sp.]|jgi:hypothetical protein|nr:DUF6148 family protein [Desulfovibrio sp.]